MAKSPHGVRAEAYRPCVMGAKGMVCSGHPLASQAGIQMLQKGGNAVDAAIAVAAALNLVEPASSGIGGDGFIMVYWAKTGEVKVANGTGKAPYAATAEMFRKMGGIPFKNIFSVSLPGICDAWLLAHERYGTLKLSEVLEPAIDLAEKGFPVSFQLAQAIAAHDPPFASIPSSAKVFAPNGRPLRAGELCRNPDLAKTFRRIAEGGRDEFYKGEIARAIVRFSEQLGGLLTMKDFEEHQSFWQEPISTTYRCPKSQIPNPKSQIQQGYIVYEAPPNSSGHILLQELNLVEHFDLKSMGYLSAESVHVMVEAKRLAFADREAYVADPEFVDIPIGWLISKEYAAERVKLIDPERAAKSVHPGKPQRYQIPDARCQMPDASNQESDTTCFCVIDRWGNAVCQLQSIQSGFGSGLIAEGTGILLNNRMTYWHLEEGHPDCLQGGKRVRHTMNPVMVFWVNESMSQRELFLVCGTPGADTQVQTNLQVITSIIDFGLNPQEAVEAPRWRHLQTGTESEYPHHPAPDELQLESRFPPETIDGLRRRGHLVKVIGAWDGPGSMMAILVDPQSGAYLGGADPRRDGYAIGW